MDELRCAVEWREDEAMASPGRLTGTLLRYGDVSPSHRETFEPGSLSWTKPRAWCSNASTETATRS